MPEDLILNVDFDQTAVEKAIDRMQKQFNDLFIEYEKNLKTVQKLDTEIEHINERERVGLKITQEEKTYREALVNQSATLSDRTQELLERTQRLGAELDSARMDPRSFAEANGYLKQTESSAGKAAQNVEKVEKNSKKAASGMREVGSGAKTIVPGVNAGINAIQKFTHRVVGLAKRVFIFSVITKAFRSIRTLMSSIVAKNDGIAKSFAKLKGNLAVAFQPILDRALPIIQKLIDKLLVASEYFVLIVHRLTGADIQDSIKKAQAMQDKIASGANSATAAYDKQIKTIDKQINALNKQVKALDKATKNLKKQYDAEKKVIELKKKALNDQIEAIEKYIDQVKKQEKAEQKVIDAQKQAIQNQIDVLNAQENALKNAQNERKKQYDAEEKAISKQISDADKQIKAIKKLKDAREDELKANEKSLASFDTLNILQGKEDEDPELAQYEAQIAALEDKKDALNEQKDAIQEAEDKTTEVYEAQTAALESQIDALEKRKDAIQDVDYSAVIEQQQSVIEGFRAQIDELDKLAEKVQEKYEVKIQVNEDAKEKIQEQIDKLGETKEKIQEAAAAAKEAADETDKLKTSDNLLGGLITDDQLEGFLFKIRMASIAIGGILLLIGSLTGNIPLIVLGFSTLLGGFVSWLNSNMDKIHSFMNRIGDRIDNFFWKLKDMTISIVEWLNDHGFGWVAEKFVYLMRIIFSFGQFLSGFFHADLAQMLKGAGNIFIGWINLVLSCIVEGLNFGINAINALIKASTLWISKLLSLFPDDSIASQIANRLNSGLLPQIPFHGIPALARGAVLPGGKPFLAMLGDQPAGQTNIEAPLDTLIQAFKAAVPQAGSGDIKVNINYNGSLSQLARVLVPEIEIEKRRRSAFYTP